MAQEGYPEGYQEGDATPTNQALRGTHLDDFLRGVETEARSFPLFDGDARQVDAPCGDVAVGHPETAQDKTGLKKFTTYEVRGSFKDGSVFCSRKRYSDFVWFRQALVTNLPGVFIPALPEKKSVGRFDKEFIEERRVRLQQFLQRIFYREEVCAALPLVQKFLTCNVDGLAGLQKDIDSRSDEAKFEDYSRVFQGTLEANSPPKSDKGFLMVKEFLAKHTPAVKAAQAATHDLLTQQAAISVKQHDLGAAIEALCDDETEFLDRAGASQSTLRSDVLQRLKKAVDIEQNGRAFHVLNASLQREIEDCDSAQECLASIEGLQQKLLATKSKISSESKSLADLKGEAAPIDDAGNVPPGQDALAQEMRKRDKTKEFFGKMGAAVMDLSAKAGINKERRISDLGKTIEKEQHEVEVLENLIASARTVFSATEITAFLETKVAGCLHAQDDFAQKKFKMYQDLADCWRPS